MRRRGGTGARWSYQTRKCTQEGWLQTVRGVLFLIEWIGCAGSGALCLVRCSLLSVSLSKQVCSSELSMQVVCLVYLRSKKSCISDRQLTTCMSPVTFALL